MYISDHHHVLFLATKHKYNQRNMSTTYPFQDETVELEVRVQDLLGRLTLDEKFHLLSGHHMWWTHPIKRLKVPKLGMSDGPRGISMHSSYAKNTQFPAPKAIAASWDRKCGAIFGKAVAEEIRARGKHVLLAPGINIDRTPLNGRTFEYFSEDPFFIKEMVVPMVKAVQKEKIAACVKHYAANNQESNRHFVSAEIDERTLREIYTKAFEFIVKESDPWSFMSCYNRVNGVYGSENKTLLWDLLVEEFGFNGFVMSDWFAVKYIQDPSTAINAGLSLEMPNTILYSKKRLHKSFSEGKFTEERLNEILVRMLRIMFKVGVFDKNVPKGSVNTKEHQQVAKEIAAASMTLLKNDQNILPLDKNTVKRVAILGWNANKKFGKPLYGGSSAVVPPFEITPLEGLKRKFGDAITIVEDPAQADVALIFTGLNHDFGQDSEAADRSQLELPAAEEQLILDTVQKNSKTIVVLYSGSPIAMDKWLDKVPALLEAWYPGQHGGDVVADTLFGDNNPSGKLPLTFPKSLKDSPAHQNERRYPGIGKQIKENLFTDAFKGKGFVKEFEDNKVFYEEGIYVGYRHFDKHNIEPLFPFGFGLSYTTFNYEKCEIDTSTVKADQSFKVKVTIKNAGQKAGAEVVQIYYSDVEASVDRPIKELCGFDKVSLNAGESKTVEIPIKATDFAFFDVNTHTWKVEAGKYKILVGASSRDIKFEKEISVN
jgi:beta-glucosidase